MHLPRPQIELRLDRGALPAAGGDVRAVLKLAVDFPPAERERDPLSLALVIDRSGSMSGAALEHAKLAAIAAVGALRDGDRVAVVAYDDRIDLVVPSTAVGPDREHLVRAIGALRAGNTTALHAGWVEGCTQVLTAPVASGVGRVVLLSDGLANVGITDPAAIAEDVARVVADGVSTSTIGLGRHFAEDLMRHLADAGHGSFHFVESPEQLDGLFEVELAGLSARRGREVEVELVGRGVRVTAALAGARPTGSRVLLPDLVAGLPRTSLLTLAVEPGAALEGLRLTWHDAFTDRRETLDVALDLPVLDAAAYAARPADGTVAAAVRVAELDARVAEVERLAGADRLPEAEALLRDLRARVANWPADDARDAQLGGLAHLLEAVADRDALLAKKRVVHEVHLRERGVTDAALVSAMTAERAWTDDHKARKAAAAARHAGPPSATARHAGHPSAPAPSARRATAAVRGRPRDLASFDLLRDDGSSVRLEVVVGDLTEEAVDALVNPSNRGLFGTAGVDGAVHRRGGPELTAACREIGRMDYGQAVVTPGYRLAAARVIHTATPPWKDGRSGELKALAATYAAAFDVARRLRLRSIALPAIGTGTHAYPTDAATEVAVDVSLRELLRPSELELARFVLFDLATAEGYRRALTRAVPQAAA